MMLVEMGEYAHSGYGFSTDSSVLGADPLKGGETVSAAVWALPHVVTTSTWLREETWVEEVSSQQTSDQVLAAILNSKMGQSLCLNSSKLWMSLGVAPV